MPVYNLFVPRHGTVVENISLAILWRGEHSYEPFHLRVVFVVVWGKTEAQVQQIGGSTVVHRIRGQG